MWMQSKVLVVLLRPTWCHLELVFFQVMFTMFDDFEGKCLITFISKLFEMLCGGLAYRHIWFNASMIFNRCWNIGRCGF